MRHVWGRSVGVGAVTDIGVRDPPSWVVRRRYEWSWLYAAIEPDTGGDLCRYLSALDGVCFEVSLQHLGERFCGEVIGSVLDNAPAHRWKGARIPENVLLVPLPPHGPELNPVERLFLEFRRELANQLFDSIDAIQSAATGFLERYWADRAALRRLTGLSWWLDAVQELWRHRIATVLERLSNTPFRYLCSARPRRLGFEVLFHLLEEAGVAANAVLEPVHEGF